MVPPELLPVRSLQQPFEARGEPDEIVTDGAAALEHVMADLLPDTAHNTPQYANDGSNATTDASTRRYDQCGLNADHTASIIISDPRTSRPCAEGTTNLATTCDTSAPDRFRIQRVGLDDLIVARNRSSSTCARRSASRSSGSQLVWSSNVRTASFQRRQNMPTGGSNGFAPSHHGERSVIEVERGDLVRPEG